MKMFLKKLLSVLGKTWVWSSLLVVVMSALVWLFGPLFAVAELRILESATSRLLVAITLLLGWGLAMVFVGCVRANAMKNNRPATSKGSACLRASRSTRSLGN